MTKLSVPPGVPHAVARTRLADQLDRHLSRKLTLDCAPAGFGKPSLLAQWAARCKRICVCSFARTGGAELQQVPAYLVAAVQTGEVRLGVNTWALLQTTPPPSAPAVLTALLNSLARYPEALLVVLDDHHRVACAPVDDALAFLIDHLPPQRHLGLVTREAPALPLAR